MYSFRFIIPVFGLLVVLLMSCASEQTVQGECQDVYGSDVCTWGTIVDGEVVQIGATIPLGSIENAPSEGEMVFPPVAVARIKFPAEVIAKTGIDHLGINWEMHGHPPTPFLTPHFDYHFFTRTGEEIEAIDCTDLTKPESVPASYILPDEEIPGLGTLVGLCVPQMGMHAVNEADNSATDIFGATMIVGYYQQEVISVEPMIAQAKLMDKQSFTINVPTDVDAGSGVAWPTGFHAEWDEAAGAYQFVFSIQ